MDVPLTLRSPNLPRYTWRRSTTRCCQSCKASKARPSNGEAKSGDEDPENPTDPTVKRTKSSTGRARNRRQGRARRPAGESKPEANGEDHGAATDASTHNGEDPSSKPRSKRTRPNVLRPYQLLQMNPNAKDAPREKASRGRTQLLFVANLPFEVTDEKLKEFFSTFKVVSAHVVCRKFGTTVGRSKGFGFVDFEDQENQLKALEELQGKEIEGRAVSIKIAVNENKKEEEENVGSTRRNLKIPRMFLFLPNLPRLD
ncbi:hypothetical protein KEM48_000969 [Puccinia striiformis f. sp. tritici PST-130]|nr:hypothetical protein KEM48_000969 [Puccinia striiformis f. sp. tritici PST-130]